MDEHAAPPTRLVGRAEDLRRVQAALDGIAAGGQALGFLGDPGVGKTAVLDAGATEGRRRGLRVLTVRGSEALTHLRFAALHELLRPVLDRSGRLPPGRRSALLSALGLNTGGLSAGGQGAAEAAPERFFVALAALELIAEAAAQVPVVLIVDDLQWVDSASRDVIMFVARRVEAEPVVVLLAARPASQDAPSGDDGVTWVPLGHLDAVAARTVLREHSPHLSASDERRVLDVAAGNPLALIELPLAVGSAVATVPDPAWPIPLTARLERSFAARVGALGPALRPALLAAALQDSDTLAETLAATADLTGDDRGSTGIDAAAAAGLLSVDGVSLRFRHPLVRSAIAQSASPAERAAVHLAFARTLAGDPDRATWHRAMAAAEPDEELAGALDAGADRAVARGAPDLAEEWLERAARLSVDDRRRGHRILRAAELAFELGRHESVHELMAAGRALPLDPPDYARLAGLEGAFDDGVPGDDDNVRRLVQAADRARDAGDEDLAANLLLGAAKPCYWGGAGEPVRDRVRASARRLSLPAADPRVMVIRALIDPFERGAVLAGQLGQWARQDTRDPALAGALSLASFVAGDFDHGLAFARQACDGLRRQGRVALLSQALVLQTFSALYLGRWDITHVASDEAYRFGAETRQPAWAACAQLGQANLAGLRGDYARARSLSAEVERTALETGNRALLSGVQLTRGFAALGSGRPEEAFGEFCRMADRADQAYQSPQCTWAVDYLAEAAAQSGHPDRARAVLREMAELIGDTTAPGVVRAVTLAHAILADGEDAEQRFSAAQDLGAAAPPWYRARLDLAYGGWLRRQRRVAAARGPLRAAQATFDALGAAAWSQRALHELAATGQRAEPHAPDGWATLSAQELQIAQLAARGLSNRDIGARLFLSHRTVGSHLYRIYPKLGVTSRAGLPAALADTGLPGPSALARSIVSARARRMHRADARPPGAVQAGPSRDASWAREVISSFGKMR